MPHEVDESIAPVELSIPPSDHTAPIERPNEEATTDAIPRAVLEANIPYDEEEPTVIGGRGDTVPIPRPLQSMTRLEGNDDVTHLGRQDDLALDLPIGTQEEPLETGTTSVVPWALLGVGFVVVALGCAGGLFVILRSLNAL